MSEMYFGKYPGQDIEFAAIDLDKELRAKGYSWFERLKATSEILFPHKFGIDNFSKELWEDVYNSLIKKAKKASKSYNYWGILEEYESNTAMFIMYNMNIKRFDGLNSGKDIKKEWDSEISSSKHLARGKVCVSLDISKTPFMFIGYCTL